MLHAKSPLSATGHRRSDLTDDAPLIAQLIINETYLSTFLAMYAVQRRKYVCSSRSVRRGRRQGVKALLGKRRRFEGATS